MRDGVITVESLESEALLITFFYGISKNGLPSLLLEPYLWLLASSNYTR
jgi:hypothetical protein